MTLRALVWCGAATAVLALAGGCRAYQCQNAHANAGGSKHTCNGRCCVKAGKHAEKRQTRSRITGIPYDVCRCSRSCPCWSGATY